MGVGGVGPNWYQDATWNNTIAPAITAAQSNYNSAQTISNAAYTVYTSTLSTYQSALITVVNLIDSNGSPTDIANAQAALATATTNLDTAQQGYYITLSQYNAASEALTAAQQTAESYIESTGDTYYENFTISLDPSIGQQLTTSGENLTDLDSQLVSADTTREATKATFDNAVTAFQQAQNNLTDARLTLQQLTGEAQVAIGNYWSDQTSANLTAMNNAENAYFAQYNTVNTLQTTRDNAESALTTAQTNYTNAIDAYVGVINSGYSQADQTATDFVNAITNAQAQADQLTTSMLQAAASSDAAQQAALLANFPTFSPALQAELQGIATESSTLAQQLTNVSVTGSVSGPLTNINLPALPAPGQAMSISDLMRFITQAQLLINQLQSNIQQSDTAINIFSMRAFNLQASEVAQKSAAISAWISQVNSADLNYNDQVIQDNAALSTTIINAINNYNANVGNINNAITALNQEITNQNALGVTIATDLNSSNQIATDTVNQTQDVVPEDVNEENTQGSDTTVTTPTPLTVPPQVGAPSTIPQYSLVSPVSTAGLISALPGLLNPSGPPEDPSQYPTLPTQDQINAVNAVVQQINAALYPIAGQISGPPINYSLIPELYIRQYTPVTTLSQVIDLPELSNVILAALYSLINTAAINLGFKQEFELIVTPLQAQAFQNSRPVTITPPSGGQSLGGGVGIQNANFLANWSTVSNAIIQALQSDTFHQVVQQLLLQAALLGGIQAALNAPGGVQNYSLLGIVRGDLQEQLQEVTTRQQQVLGQTTAASIIATAQNNNVIRQAAQLLADQQSGIKLDQQAIQQLLALLRFLIQLVLLLAASLVAGATGANVNEIANAIAPTTNANTAALTSATGTSPDIGQASTTEPLSFASTLDKLFSSLAPSDQTALQEGVSTIFTATGLPPLGNAPSFGTNVQNALNTAPFFLAEVLQKQITDAAIQAAARQKRALSASQLIDEITNSSAQTSELNSRNLVSEILASNNAHTTLLSDEDQSSLIAALNTNRITTEQAQQVVERLLLQNLSATNPTLANLFQNAINANTVTASTPLVSSTLNPASPTKPEDTLAMIHDAFEQLRRQTDDQQLINTVTRDFSQFIETQSDFFQLSIKLILDPGNTFVKNFSPFTRTLDKKDLQTPLILPISG